MKGMGMEASKLCYIQKGKKRNTFLKNFFFGGVVFKGKISFFSTNKDQMLFSSFHLVPPAM